MARERPTPAFARPAPGTPPDARDRLVVECSRIAPAGALRCAFSFMRPLYHQIRLWQRLRRGLKSLGPARATVLLSSLAALGALVLSQSALWLTGHRGDASAALLALACAGLIAPLVAWPLLRLWTDAEAARARLDVLATRDDLTGAYNRRQFLVLADREWARCRRYATPAAVLMIDVDHFKRVNDLHGHLAGDLMLREIARAIGGTLRQADLFGRFGGEEFIVFLPHADTLGALDAAERIRDNVSRIALEWRGQTIRTTVSLGVASLDAEHDTLGAWIADADLALYSAKDAGRNCARTTPTPHPHRPPRGDILPTRHDGHDDEARGPWGKLAD
jgi:diguanylate cyclase (GGDEF)-like protein